MKAVDVRAKTDDELKESLSDLRKEQFNLRFQRQSGQLEDTARVRTVRRDIARIETILAERAAGNDDVAAKPAKKKAAPKKAKAKTAAKKPAAKKKADDKAEKDTKTKKK